MSSVSLVSPVIDRDEWLKERLTGIGSSEAATAIGLSGFQTRLALFLKKRGDLEEFEGNEATRWGTRLEPLIAEAYSEATGFGFESEQLFVRSEQNPFAFATLDRVRRDKRIVELKSVGARMASEWGESGSDEVPRGVAVQVLHQLAVTGMDTADVAALICGQELRIYTIDRDDEAIAVMLEREAEFWERVQTGTPPEADLDRDGKLMVKLFPRAVGEIELGPRDSELIEEWEAVKQSISESEKSKTRLQTAILETLGDAASAKLTNGRIITRKVVSVAERTQTVKAYSYPLLKLKGSPNE